MMIKKWIKGSLTGLLAAAVLFGCYGKFPLTRKVYEMNGSIQNKFAKSALTWVLIIVQVYSVLGLVDFAILNVIEFWTGSNPLAMEEGQVEEQIVEKDGKQYKITATKNRLDIESLNQSEATQISMRYNEEKKSWFVQTQDGTFKVAELEDNNVLSLLAPDGQLIERTSVTQ
ncbi:MAG: DUF3332 family protein [Fibrobacteria bacterium]|nr:DUF3332 family protein [Fibrobacteria bacterium]